MSKHLTFIERGVIATMLKYGYTQTAIAQEIGVHKSTISRELKRNEFWRGTLRYMPNHAQAYTDSRHRHKHKKVKFTDTIQEFVTSKVKLGWSPDQISGYAKKHALFSISHERIYQFLLADKKQGGDLYKHLRHQHKKYRKRYGSPAHKSPIKDRVFIDDRPSIVDEKSRIGDWEIDTIIGKNQKQAILSIVERTSKLVTLKKLSRKTSLLTKQAALEALMPYKDQVLTITGDNGSEFAMHKQISDALEADFYFAHPYSSWERGINEHTNGLVRQYIKKGSELTTVDDDKLRLIAESLNNRPRKCLNYLTPYECFDLLSIT